MSFLTPFYHRFASIMYQLREILFPRYCQICGNRLMSNERHVCLTCLLRIPYTRLRGKKNSVLERNLWDDILYTERAHSFMYYHAKTDLCQIFFQFKYYNNPSLAVTMGELMAHDLDGTDFFLNIDCIVPVPLSSARFQNRGYNQSERLAQGISNVTGIPVDTWSICRTVDNPTQTHLHSQERMDNVRGIFALTEQATIAGKHILIVDDMITTGSTVRSCAHTALAAGNVKISIISLGMSERNREHEVPEWIRP